MAKIQIFSDSIIVSELINTQLHQRINEVLEEYIASNQNRKVSNSGGFHTPDIQCPFILKTLTENSGILLKENYVFKKNTSLKISSAWINKNFKYNFNRPHVHRSNFSGIYYVQTPEKEGNLVFLKESFSEELCNNQHFIENSFHTSFRISPKPNQLILFPSNYMHLVEPHFEDKPRISVAFNIDFFYG